MDSVEENSSAVELNSFNISGIKITAVKQTTFYKAEEVEEIGRSNNEIPRHWLAPEYFNMLGLMLVATVSSRQSHKNQLLRDQPTVHSWNNNILSKQSQNTKK